MADSRIAEVQATQKEPKREPRIFTFKAPQVVWLFFGILEALVALRIVSAALNAGKTAVKTA